MQPSSNTSLIMSLHPSYNSNLPQSYLDRHFPLLPNVRTHVNTPLASSHSGAAKPKPIYISGKNPDELNSILGNLLPEAPKMKVTKNSIRIDCQNTDAHSRLMKHLSASPLCINFHTFQMKHKKLYRAIIRHLDKATPISWIREQLTKLGFLVSSVNSVKNRQTKEVLNLFQIAILYNNQITVKQLLETKQLGNRQISVEPQLCLTVAQCHRCQRFGHTKNYCQHPFACVKCAGKHPSTTCTVSKTSLKCANCKGKHTANYLGCPAYKIATKLVQAQPFSNEETMPIARRKPAFKAAPSNQNIQQGKTPILKSHLLSSFSPSTQRFITNLSYAEAAANQKIQRCEIPKHKSSPVKPLQQAVTKQLQQQQSQLLLQELQSPPQIQTPNSQFQKLGNIAYKQSLKLHSHCTSLPKQLLRAPSPQRQYSQTLADDAISAKKCTVTPLRNQVAIKHSATPPEDTRTQRLQQRLLYELALLSKNLNLVLNLCSPIILGQGKNNTQVNKTKNVPTTI